MDISDGHRADNPEDSCASVKRSQIAPYGAVWPFHLCLLRRDVCVCAFVGACGVWGGHLLASCSKSNIIP